jgi:hypothetical protein
VHEYYNIRACMHLKHSIMAPWWAACLLLTFPLNIIFEFDFIFDWHMIIVLTYRIQCAVLIYIIYTLWNDQIR